MNLSSLKPKIDLDSLPPDKKKLLLVGLPLVITAIVGYFVCFPLFESMDKLETETAKQREEIKNSTTKAANLTKIKAEYAKLLQELKVLEQQLPDEKEVSSLLKKTSELGTKADLQVLLWKPKDKVLHTSKEVYQIPVEVEMRGGYHSLGQFYSSITKLDRLVTISDISMFNAGIKTRPSDLKVKFVVTTYSSLSEKERQEMKEKEAREKAEKEKKK